MNPKYNVFGGWLRFYQVLSIVSIAGGVFSLVVIVYYTLSNQPYDEKLSIYDAFMSLMLTIINLWLAVLTLRVIKNKEKETPNRIDNYLFGSMAASVIHMFISYIMYKLEIVKERPDIIFIEIFYFLIWSSYFRKSKRVNAYYGDTVKMDITTPLITFATLTGRLKTILRNIESS